MEILPPFIADAEAPELMPPRDGALHDPAEDAQATAMRGVAAGQDGGAARRAQLAAVGLRIVGAVTLDALRSTPWAAPLPAEGRNGLYARDEWRHIVSGGCRQPDGSGDPTPIRHAVGLAPQLPSIRRVRARCFPPRRARMAEDLTIARDQSSASAACNCASHTRWSLAQPPARCQACSRRQQVMPDPPPHSIGRASHGMPVLSTKSIPVRTCRLSRGWRPGARRRRRLGGGSSGARQRHNRSSTRTFAMQASSLWDDSGRG